MNFILLRKASLTPPATGMLYREASGKTRASVKKKSTKTQATSVSPSPSNTKHAAALIKVAPITFNIVLNQLTKNFNVNVDEAIKEVVTFHDRMIKNHSVVEGTARFNSIRLYAIHLLEGRNPDPLERVAVGRKDRWPSAFNLLRPLYYRVRDEGCKVSDRVIRSILYLNRLCEGNGVPDFKEIEKPFDVSAEFRKRYQTHINSRVQVAELELITKPTTRVLRSGPNSKPKWMTAEVEAYALLNSKLHDPFRNLCIATGNKDLYNYMKEIASKQSRVDRKRLRYITTVRDKGNKCRLVAISDYWTQVLLEPIATDIQQYTKKRFGKVSFSHDHAKGFNNLKKFIRPGVESYDVSSWTDAFPSSLQLDFMIARYGRPIAYAWYDLVVSCEWNAKGRKDPIKYARGQGMGTNGSFDIATITDLFLLEMIYAEDYQMPITESTFNKVGDDLWCYDPDKFVYNTYTIECGIDINKSKTKSATEGNLCGEFVSRSINHGKDVSRISANICRAVKKNILDLPQLASHLEERDYESIIPLQEVFRVCKVKEHHVPNYVRTFFLLSRLYPRQGLQLLEKSIKECYPTLYYEDNIIVIVKTYGIDCLRDSFNLYLVSQLLNSIIDKTSLIFDAATEFDSSEMLAERAMPDKWWVTEDPIELLTSKFIMAKSFGALNGLYAADEFGKVINVVETLQTADQAMTFKELGVISTSDTVWRPKATKLFKFVKSLVQQDFSPHDSDRDIYTINLSEDVPDLVTQLQLPINDPIFKGVPFKVIGSK